MDSIAMLVPHRSHIVPGVVAVVAAATLGMGGRAAPSKCPCGRGHHGNNDRGSRQQSCQHSDLSFSHSGLWKHKTNLKYR